MSKHVLSIKHVSGKVEVTALDGHNGKPVSGTLVLGKPSDYDSLSEAELRAALPPIGDTKVDASALPVKKAKSRKKKTP